MKLEDQLSAVTTRLGALIDAAPDEPESRSDTVTLSRSVSSVTGLPARYRPEWERPADDRWTSEFGKIMRCVSAGGIIALIGPRGTGKTRLAAEALRNFSPDKGSYATAMGLFIRIRATFGKKGGEDESDIVRELTLAPLLVLDEVQERGNSAWEDRLLTHVLDARYGAMRPTILIANLTESALIEQLGDSIVSRLQETGGVLLIDGPSHRIKS